MRKRILMFLICALFILTGMGVASCGQNAGDSAKTFKALQEVVGQFTQSDAPFSHASVGGIETSFYIKNFKHRDNGNQPVDDDENYLVLCAVSLNYIFDYYEEIENLKNQYNFTPLYKSAVSLTKKYNEMKNVGDELDGLGSNAQNFVYNGYFAKYKIRVKDFVIQAYNTAASLGNLLMNNVKITSNLGKDGQTQEDIDKYLDYQYLMVFKDFSDFFLVSSDGQVLDNSVYNTVKTNMSLYCSQILATPNKAIDTAKAKELIAMSDAFNGERRMYGIAIKKFSMYDFTTQFEALIVAYEKSYRDADVAFEEICRHLTDANSAHTTYFNYLKNNIKND